MKECPKCQHCYADSSNFCPFDNTPLMSTIYGDAVISGRYILEKRLGKGGMGIVFRAKHKFLKSLHAIKVILPSLVDQDSNLLTRFKQEAILAASINHPNVIRVTDFGVEDERMPFLVMEYVNGKPLSLFFSEEKRLPVEKAYLFFQPIALGVAEAHNKGIVHRDLKPQNIIVEDNLPLHKAVKVLDFGLAKIKSVESIGSLVQANTMNILGSPQYMSPEQWENEGVDHRTDIYGLGVILYQMLTGHLPFDGDTIPAVMYQHLTAAPPAFSSFGVSLSSGIESVVRKSLEKKQSERFESVEEMLGDLEQALGGSTIAVNVGNFLPGASKDNLSGANRFSNDKTRNLSESQKQRILTYFDASDKPAGILADEQLAHEFLDAQDRAEQAKMKATQAEKLVKELAEAQKSAEEAQQKAIEARQKIEADVRRRVEAEMETKLAQQQARQKAEAERLTKEAEARRQAEERANYLAQAALEAQKIAEAERKKSEQAAHQRELEEGVRRQAEITAARLAEQVTEAKQKYEEAIKQAEAEAEMRRKAELKRQKIEAELQIAAEKEAERRARSEAEVRKQIEEQAQRFEEQALDAQKRVDEARHLAETEAQKREEAESARQRAEEEARRLAQEIIEVQKRMEEIKFHSSNPPSSQQTLNLLDLHSAGHLSASSNDSAENQSPVTVQKHLPSTTGELKEHTVPNIIIGQETSAAHQTDLGSSLLTIESKAAGSSNQPFSDLSNIDRTARRKISVPIAAAGGLAVIFTFLVGGFLVYSFIKPDPEIVENTNQQTNKVSNPEPVSPKPELILIKGGSFQMGRDDAKSDPLYGDQFPAHTEQVEDFLMSKTETTNEEYAEFTKEKNYPVPRNWENGAVSEEEKKLPVTYVSLADAEGYADWFSARNGKKCRIPTEIEWEYAARNGSQTTDFPWGNEWNPDYANISTSRLAEVGKYPEATSDGIKDMLGNVSEWTTSKYSLYKGSNLETPTGEKKGNIVYRGMSLITNESYLKNSRSLTTFRYHTMAEERASWIGFRLVCEP